VIAPFVLDGPINRLAFETYVERVLTPELRQGDVVVMDNLSSHKGQKVRERIEAAGASLFYLPPYSPDFNPIEKRLRQAQSPAAQSRRANRPRSLDRHRPNRRSLRLRRMSKLLRRRRIRCNPIGYRSSMSLSNG
jgi:transposase